MWNSANRNFSGDFSLIGQVNPMLGDVFYISSYFCPKCGRPMYKTVFPYGGEYRISISNGRAGLMKRVFTCPRCYYFATPASSTLGNGSVYEHNCSSSTEYLNELGSMSRYGTTEGRSDGGIIIV